MLAMVHLKEKKKDKERSTVTLCTNASGTDKIMLFVIRPAIKDDDNLMKELYENIEMLNYQNIMDLEEYINYSDKKIITGIISDQEILNQATYQESEQAENDEEDDSAEILQITHKEALDAINRLEFYLMQHDLDNAARTEHDIALSKLYESVRKFWNASFKQISIEAFLEPTCNVRILNIFVYNNKVIKIKTLFNVFLLLNKPEFRF
ncbi:44532_t:CDS:2 [Gigaspora margarita]|uniref:44532_t:CDS:1 n=1 Tax=Gigaspora margarita TaxID=4874 RepID=A0ABN7VCY3_GIGMA|nr:44532_t:CDS:2 [Gigaspora margarita]